MKELAAQHAVQRLSLQTSPRELRCRRAAAESALSRKAKEAGLDEEYALSAVYDTVCASLPELQGASQRLASLELEVEEALTSAMPGIAGLLARLSADYRIIAVSDTYLPGPFLERLLEKAKLAQFFGRVYASCDHACNKGSGALFRRVLEIEGCPPSLCLHIGDNLLSDYFRPRSLGINAIHLQDAPNLKRKARQSALNEISRLSPAWKGFEALGALTSTTGSDCADPAKGKLYDWGYKTVAPPVVLFIHELCLRLLSEPDRGVYFLAREGYLLKRLYEMFNRVLFGGRLPEGRYLCLSRSTAFRASLFDIGEREIDLVLQDYSIRFDDVLRRFGIDGDQDIARICRQCGVSPALADKGAIRNLLLTLASDRGFRALVDAGSREMRRKLDIYLESEALFSWDEVALVDVGWHGTIQDYLEKYLQLRGSGPRVHGYYLGVDHNVSCNYSSKTGLLHDFRQPTIDGVCLTFFRLAFEFSLRAGHGTTTGYHCDASGVPRPIFRRDLRESEAFRHIRSIQEGIAGFATSYMAVAGANLFRPEQLTPAFLNFHNLRISFPDRDTIAAFAPVIHSEDHATDRVRYITGSFKLSEFAAPRQLLSRFIEMPWREAALARLHIPFLLVFYHLFKRSLAGRRIKAYPAGERGEAAPGVAELHPSGLALFVSRLALRRIVSMATGILVRLLDVLPARAALFAVLCLIRMKARVVRWRGWISR